MNSFDQKLEMNKSQAFFAGSIMAGSYDRNKKIEINLYNVKYKDFIISFLQKNDIKNSSTLNLLYDTCKCDFESVCSFLNFYGLSIEQSGLKKTCDLKNKEDFLLGVLYSSGLKIENGIEFIINGIDKDFLLIKEENLGIDKEFFYKEYKENFPKRFYSFRIDRCFVIDNLLPKTNETIRNIFYEKELL